MISCQYCHLLVTAFWCERSKTQLDWINFQLYWNKQKIQQIKNVMLERLNWASGDLVFGFSTLDQKEEEFKSYL